VAYETLLQERRRALHAGIVEALETLIEDRVGEQVERLAHHALRGEVWDKAVTYCQQAGARANDRAAFREALASYEQALQVLAHLREHGDTRVLAIELRLALGGALTQLGEYGRHLALAVVLGMRPLMAHCHLGLGTLYAQISRSEQACAQVSTAITLYRAMDMTFWLPRAEGALAQVVGAGGQ
jgi:tetratricopeptide (TPR) repeat protein